MSAQKQIELGTGNTMWVTLHQDQNGIKRLELAPEVTKLQIDSYVGGLGAYRSDGTPLRIERGADHIKLTDRDGITQLTLNLGRNDEIIDVHHPFVKLLIILAGAGTVANDPIQSGTPLFGLRWK